MLILFLASQRFEELSIKYSNLFNSSPEKIQEFINSNLPHRNSAFPLYSAYSTLKNKTGSCLECAFVAALFLEQKYKVRILNLDTDKNIGHALYLFEENSLFGTVGNSSRESLRWREPKYKTVEELVETFRKPLADAGYILGKFIVDNLENARDDDWKYSLRDLGNIGYIMKRNKFCPNWQLDNGAP